MVHSKFLSTLTKEQYQELTKKLFEIQNGKCFICEKEIDLDVQTTNIDHIVPIVNKGKDDESNFALAHEHCNKSKLDADLRVAKILSKLENIKANVEKNKQATLADVLKAHDGGKYDFKYIIDDDAIRYSFDELGVDIHNAPVHTDELSGEKSAFIEVPIEYIHHDGLINPRGINNSIGLLIKEFYKGNPQLHLSLARIDEGKLKIFDGQHKAVAQIMLGVRKLMLRVFIEPDIERLIETNTNAGSKLKQIAFDKSIIRQLHNTLLHEKIVEYQNAHNLSPDDYSFSEQDLVEFFKGERGNVKQYIINSQKDIITRKSELVDYIDFEGRSKEKPISYSAFEKTFLATFVNPKTILNKPIGDSDDNNPRILESTQLIKLCNILAETIYVGKFDIEVGTHRIEQSVLQGKDKEITDDHLIAYRVSKEEIMANWMKIIAKVVQSYFLNTGLDYDEENMFQQKIPEQLWSNIENFVKNFVALPLWKDRGLAETIFSGKNNYEYWATIFKTGQTVDGVQVLLQPVNFQEMLK